MSALLELEDIHFGYARQAPVLRGASLRLHPGERIGLVGANGTGKSTLLRIALGLIRPSRGLVRGFGQPCRSEAQFRDLRRRVGLVFQDPDDQLFCPTVAEDIAFGPLNLGLGRAEALARVDAVLEQLALSHLRHRITHHLSGGEKRLVTLASVLVMRPEVLILDEPTNALDPENEARLTAILRDLPQAMLLVSHDPAFRSALVGQDLRLVEGQLRP